jgi:hypothetical protein
MAHIWVLESADDWVPIRLSAPFLALPEALPLAGISLEAGSAAPLATLLQSAGGGGRQRWVLLSASQGLHVNGVPLLTGMRVLLDHDEIRLGTAGSIFFSAESPAVVEAYPASAAPTKCARCTQVILPGMCCVRCPHCGVFWHQSEDWSCWTYSPQCICGQPTALDGSFRWSPEDL